MVRIAIWKSVWRLQARMPSFPEKFATANAPSSVVTSSHNLYCLSSNYLSLLLFRIQVVHYGSCECMASSEGGRSVLKSVRHLLQANNKRFDNAR